MKNLFQYKFRLPIQALIVFTLLFIGCEKTLNHTEPVINICSTSRPEILSVSKPLEIDSKSFNSYMEKTSIKNDGSLSIHEVITYVDNPIRSIVLQKDQLCVDSSSIIIMSYYDNELLDYSIEIDVLDVNNQINIFYNTTLFASILFDPMERDEIEYIVYSPSGNDFIRCFRTALNACLQDPEVHFYAELSGDNV
ncbi:MAG TPA: hypothetical protein PKE03_12295 [Bacteroidales bacterium]|nr:hypothetical protein [Bacteroidales bacterium]